MLGREEGERKYLNLTLGDEWRRRNIIDIMPGIGREIK